MIRSADRLANFRAILSNHAMEKDTFDCRADCGACCIAPSITSPIPGMPQGKPAGMLCAQLDQHLRCKIFGQASRPAFCAGLQPSAEMCGDSREAALTWLAELEHATCPHKAD